MHSDSEDAAMHNTDNRPRVGLTMSDVNADLGRRKKPRVTCLGRCRQHDELHWYEWLYLAVMLVSLVAVIAFTIYRMVTVDSTDPDFTFGFLLLWSAAFNIWFAIEGVFGERPSEIIILTIAANAIVIYLFANFFAGSQETVKLVRLIVATVLSVLLIIPLGLWITRKYHLEKHLIIRTLRSASEDLQNLLSKLLVFQDLLKLDLMLGGSMIILVIKSHVSVEIYEYVILAVGFAIKIGWCVLGWKATMRESEQLVWVFFGLCWVEVAYICYKLYDMSQHIDAAPGLAGATITCAVLAIITRISVVIMGVLVYRGFGKGLKEKLNSSSGSGQHLQQTQASSNPPDQTASI